LDEANRAYFRNDREAAAVIVNKLLKYDQKNAAVLRLAGDIFADSGRRKEAIVAYKKALAAQGPNLVIQDKINRLQSVLSASSGGQDISANRPSANGSTKVEEEDKPSFLQRILGGAR
jgi:predicted Zn-dependent protease